MHSASRCQLEDYLLFHVVNSFANDLPSSIVEARFNFFEKELKGIYLVYLLLINMKKMNVYNIFFTYILF